MKNNWPTKILGEVCEKITDGSHFSPPVVEIGFPYITVKDISWSGEIDLINCKMISEDSYRKLVKNGCQPRVGDVLFSKDGTVGKLAKITRNENFVVLSSLAILRPSKILDQSYLYWVMNSPDFLQHALRSKTGAALQRVVLKTIKEFEIPLPPLSEQKKIVAKLEKLLAKVNEAKRLRAEALEAASQLLPAELHKIFEEGKKEGWNNVLLGEIAQYFIGLTYSPNDKSDEGVIVLRSSNVQNDSLDFSDLVRVTTNIKDNLFVKEGDILMCSRNGSKRLIGKTAVITKLQEKMTFGAFMTIIRSHHNPFLYWFFKSNTFFNQFDSGGGPMINQITKYMLNEIKVPLPSINEQKKIVARLDSISEKARQLQEYQNTTERDFLALEQSILHQAFQGNL